MKNNHKFSVIITAYQEESGINNILTELINLRKENPFIDEIIVVDDGSNDKTGIKNAKNGIITITDADCTFPIPSLLFSNKTFMALENI